MEGGTGRGKEGYRVFGRRTKGVGTHNTSSIPVGHCYGGVRSERI